MGKADDQEQLRADIDKTRIEYLLTDADVAMTFIEMARDPLADEPKRARLREKASKAYRDIVRLTRDVALDEPILEQLRNKLQEVRSGLKELGEAVTLEDMS